MGGRIRRKRKALIFIQLLFRRATWAPEFSAPAPRIPSKDYFTIADADNIEEKLTTAFTSIAGSIAIAAKTRS